MLDRKRYNAHMAFFTILSLYYRRATRIRIVAHLCIDQADRRPPEQFLRYSMQPAHGDVIVAGTMVFFYDVPGETQRGETDRSLC